MVSSHYESFAESSQVIQVIFSVIGELFFLSCRVFQVIPSGCLIKLLPSFEFTKFATRYGMAAMSDTELF